MKPLRETGTGRRKGSAPLRVLLLAGAAVGFISAVLLFLRAARPGTPPVETGANAPETAETTKPYSRFTERAGTRRTDTTGETKESAQEIVARKVSQFSKTRRDLVYSLAKHYNVAVPAEVERFFRALESGRWEEIDAAHTALLEDPKQLNQPRSGELHQIWRPIQEAWGAAREAHDWPAQRLLDYGNSILGSLRPGMIYAGGTDPGCFIATMLNDTSEGEHHIVLTQNALADGTYLKYLNFQYGDRMNTLTDDDSQTAFNAYTEDAKKRLLHDQQFPDEPKQVKPGEDIHVDENGAVKVSG